VYQADLATIGVKLTLSPLEPATFQQLQGTRAYKGLWFTSGAFTQFGESGSSLTIGVNPDNNIPQFQSPQYSSLVNAATVEPDAAKRKQLYSQINDLILDEAFIWPLALSFAAQVSRTNVQGMAYREGSGSVPYQNMWLAA